MLPIICFLDIIIGLIISIFSFDLKIYFEILIGIGFGIGLLLIEALIFFLIVIIVSIPIKKNKRYKYSKFYSKLFLNYEKFALRLFNVKIYFKNKELLPNDNYSLISNHKSNIDSFVMDKVLKNKKLIFAAKKSLFGIPWFGKIIWRNNYLYITRNDNRNDIKELNYGIDLVNNYGYSIGIFPEGKRNFTEDIILPFYKGYQLLLNKTKKPLVIASIKNTSDVNNHLFIKRHKVTFEILGVIYYEKYHNMDKEELNLYASNLIKNSLEEK